LSKRPRPAGPALVRCDKARHWQALCSCLARPDVVPVPGLPHQPVVPARARHGNWAGTILARFV